MNELLAYLESIKKYLDNSFKPSFTLTGEKIGIEMCLDLLFKGWNPGDKPYYINENGLVCRGVITFFEIDANESIASVNDGDDQEYLLLKNLFRTKADAIAELERRRKL